MGDSEGRVLGLYILTYNTQTRYPNRNVPQTMVPFYANTDVDARIEARRICEEEEEKLGRTVYFEGVEAYPHGFTTGARTWPGKIEVDAEGNRIPPLEQQRPFPSPPS